MGRSVQLQHIQTSLPSIPIGAVDRAALERLGRLCEVSPWTLDQAFRLIPGDKEDEKSVWIRPHRTDHRAVWNAAWSRLSARRVEDGSEGFDIDHVFPRSWALAGEKPVQFVRLFPVWSGVNRSAGAGLEKSLLRRGQTRCTFDNGVYFAGELQLHKILGLDPGEVSD